jgi:eukaryotic-like serine/threonine-protein kinase
MTEHNTIPETMSKADKEFEKARALPEKIGPYKILHLIGQGAMGMVYLGKHPNTHSPVSIKVLLKERLANEDIIKRFHRECEIMSTTEHPNITKLYEHGSWEGDLYIATEFVHGISLTNLIKHKSTSLKQALRIVLDVCYALSHFHALGIIHRDLKPNNILMTDSGDIKVIDFGIAQLSEHSPTDKHPTFVGTPAYMSPEQKKDPRNVSFNSDIYSLAIITYELIVGRFSDGIVHLELTPQDVQKILTKALEIDPKDRYQTIEEFIHSIKEYLDSPDLHHDQRGAEYVSELVEGLKQAQDKLIPQARPLWEKVELGIFNHRAQTVSGIYFDFLDLPGNTYGVIMGEPCSQGIETLLYSAVLRGMIRSICHAHPEPAILASKLNDILVNDPMDQMFALSYLTMNPSKNTVSYISCGYGNLWHIPKKTGKPTQISADNIALGIDDSMEFIEVQIPWEIGDKLILNSFSTVSTQNKEQAFHADDLKKALEETNNLHPQKQLKILFRKIRAIMNQPLAPRPITLIDILRKE